MKRREELENKIKKLKHHQYQQQRLYRKKSRFIFVILQ